MTIEQFIESISTIPYRSLEREFDFARKNQALVTPHLLNILEKTLESLNKSRSNHVQRTLLPFTYWHCFVNRKLTH